LQCAENTARWLIDEIATRRQPTEGDTRDFFDLQWQQTALYESPDAIQKEYEEGVLACSRVRDLIRRCEVLQPVSPYALSLDGITITGEYAVLRSRRRKIKTFIPYAHRAFQLRVGDFRWELVRPRQVIPDMVTFVRSHPRNGRTERPG